MGPIHKNCKPKYKLSDPSLTRHSGFKFLSNDQLESFDYKNISVEENVGYM